MARTHYRRRRRRGLKSGTLALLILLTCTFLVSCVAGTNALWIRGLFGLDVGAYLAEPTEHTLSTGADTAKLLCDMVDILLAGSISIPSFRNTSQLLEHYRDALLNDMLRDNYTLYTGNEKILQGVQKAEPYVSISTAIPAEDLSNMVNRYFGNEVSNHRSGSAYAYLPRAEVYTTALHPWEATVDIVVVRIEETAHTYRMYFQLTDGLELSEEYLACFVKREDGSVYFRSLQEA